MANLPQIDKKGYKLSGSYGYFNGEHAFSLGLSGTNDLKNLTYRSSGSLNTKGYVSFGYQFDKLETRKKDMLTLQRNGNINMLDEKVYEHDIKIKELDEKIIKNNKDLEDKISKLEELTKALIKNQSKNIIDNLLSNLVDKEISVILDIQILMVVINII